MSDTEIEWKSDSTIAPNAVIWHATLGPYSAIVVDQNPALLSRVVLASVTTPGNAEGVWASLRTDHEAKAWAEKLLRKHVAQTNEQLDELAALDQEMGLY